LVPWVHSLKVYPLFETRVPYFSPAEAKAVPDPVHSKRLLSTLIEIVDLSGTSYTLYLYFDTCSNIDSADSDPFPELAQSQRESFSQTLDA